MWSKLLGHCKWWTNLLHKVDIRACFCLQDFKFCLFLNSCFWHLPQLCWIILLCLYQRNNRIFVCRLIVRFYVIESCLLVPAQTCNCVATLHLYGQESHKSPCIVANHRKAMRSPPMLKLVKSKFFVGLLIYTMSMGGQSILTTPDATHICWLGCSWVGSIWNHYPALYVFRQIKDVVTAYMYFPGLPCTSTNIY